MSNLLPRPEAEECVGLGPEPPQVTELPQREVKLGDLTVRRVLPVRSRRMIGPWCFFDRYGPLSFTDSKPMDVAPHPHIGLQTVSWLFSGEVVHHDSLGSECLIRPGQISLMTAGAGITHTEETPVENSGQLNGVQLWVALPDSVRQMKPEYHCSERLEAVEQPGGLLTTFYGGRHAYSESVGAELVVRGRMAMPLDPRFEYGVMAVDGEGEIDGVRLERDRLYDLGTGRQELAAVSHTGAKLVLIGGRPFGETILMWWNFVARTQEELQAARTAWETHEWFPEVRAYQGPRLAAPPFAGRPLPGR